MNILNIVLIETSWNVKGYPDDKKTKFVGVLIETSWNVKNRRHTTADKITSVLIETSWNVKSRRYWASWYCLEVLIETSWNVKRYVAVIVAEPVFCINRNIVECKGTTLDLL